MEPNPHVIPTPRYAAVVTPNFKGGEKRLVFAAPTEPCMYDLTLNPTKLPFTLDTRRAGGAENK